MEKFSPQLRVDLQEVYGVSLPELFGNRCWVHLLALIDGLPQHSRYMAALLSDEEAAEEIVNHPDFGKGEDTGPSLIGYGQTNYQLAELIDGMKALQATLIGVNGGKARSPKPTKRPQTAIDKVKAKKVKEASQQTIDLFSHKSE